MKTKKFKRHKFLVTYSMIHSEIVEDDGSGNLDTTTYPASKTEYDIKRTVEKVETKNAWDMLQFAHEQKGIYPVATVRELTDDEIKNLENY